MISGDKKELWKENTAQITAVELSPDFDASGAFDFPDYSQVRRTRFIKKDGTALSDFKWEDGKLVAPMDEDFVDTKLQENLAVINTGPSGEKKAPAKLSLLVNKLDSEAVAQVKEEAWLYILTTAGLIVLIIGWIVYRMVKRRGESK